MREELTDRDRRAVIPNLREILTYVIIDRKLAVSYQQHDCGRGELLRDRRDVKDRRRCDRRPGLEIRHSVSVLIDDSSIAADADGAAGRIRTAPGLEDMVDGARGRIAPVLGRCGGRRRQCDGYG